MGYEKMEEMHLPQLIDFRRRPEIREYLPLQNEQIKCNNISIDQNVIKI